ncbi:hypothetical protein ACEZDB_26940 [Streptacidiphilus sp. N1-3]|uniref:Uncharacterized protein n=1 Tax=Streptacidiphilus alkalitolerans TaxID=3342712 RepID=A0ABV6X7L4_9ACTN
MIVTLGMALFGLALCAIALVPWFRKSGGGKAPGGKGAPAAAGGRNYRALLPFVGSLCVGIVVSVAVGGFIGTMASWGRKGGGQAGDDALQLLTGARSYQTEHAAATRLGAGSAVVLLLILTVMVLLWRKGAKALRRDIGLGLLAGINLGPTAAGLGFASSVLLPVLISAGGQVQGWL